jgi:hypothetical protein
MNAQELAAALHNREYGDEITAAEERLAKESGLVVVFGASDDLMEFRGAVHDEIGAWEGGVAYFTNAGLLDNECGDEDCPYFEKLKTSAATVKAKWDAEGYSWVYETAIPHVTFDILEDGGKYCRGIVFALADVSSS